MKRFLNSVAVLIALMVLCVSVPARAQVGPTNVDNMIFFYTSCATATLQTPGPLSGYAFCVDATGVYPWNGSAFVAPSGQAVASLLLNEGVAPSGVAAVDVLYGDSTAHTVKAKMNNGAAIFMATEASAIGANVVAKATGTNAALAASSITDNGTNVVSSEPICGKACTTNAAAGDFSSGTSATSGALWFGTGNNASLDFGETTAGKFTLAGPSGGDLRTTNGNIQAQAGNLIAGTAATTTGKLLLNGGTGGTLTVAPQASFTSYEFDLPTTAGTAGQALVSGGGSGTAMAYQAIPQTVQFSGALGGLASTAAATLLQACGVATSTGHIVDLNCTTDLNGGACTTAPQYNVRDNTAATTGTAKTCSTSAGNVDQTESLAVTAGDVVCLVRTGNGGTCTTPVFHVLMTLNGN